MILALSCEVAGPRLHSHAPLPHARQVQERTARAVLNRAAQLAGCLFVAAEIAEYAPASNTRLDVVAWRMRVDRHEPPLEAFGRGQRLSDRGLG